LSIVGGWLDHVLNWYEVWMNGNYGVATIIIEWSSREKDDVLSMSKF
jgi:hypothetical protein